MTLSISAEKAEGFNSENIYGLIQNGKMDTKACVYNIRMVAVYHLTKIT